MMIARWALVAVWLTLVSDSLRAEPITWNYSSGYSNLRQFKKVLPLEGWDRAVLSGGNANSTATADVSNRPAGSAQGSAVVTVGDARPGTTYAPNSYYYLNGVPFSFQFAFELQDVKSGQRGTIAFDGKVSESALSAFDPPHNLYDRTESFYIFNPTGPWLASESLRLGENRYHVELKQRAGAGGVAFIDADVRVETAATPEPSTILMGGIGLVGMGLGWIRKRRWAKS